MPPGRAVSGVERSNVVKGYRLLYSQPFFDNAPSLANRLLTSPIASGTINYRSGGVVGDHAKTNVASSHSSPPAESHRKHGSGYTLCVQADIPVLPEKTRTSEG